MMKAYPIQKQALTTEYLREDAHLRSRAAGPAAVLRLRDTVMRETQKFFEVGWNFTYDNIAGH